MPKVPWRGGGGAYSIGKSVEHHPSTISNNYSETTDQIVTKFYIEPSVSSGTKNCSNSLGHMTNMAHIL